MATGTGKKPTATAVAELEVEMVYDKDTPGTLRFREDVEPGERGAIGTLYITKKALSESGVKGKSIIVTVRDA